MIKPVYRLEATPIVNWLSTRVKAYGTVESLAYRLDVDYTWVKSLLKGKYKTIEIDKADDILCKDGTSHLREIYPELYEE